MLATQQSLQHTRRCAAWHPDHTGWRLQAVSKEDKHYQAVTDAQYPPSWLAHQQLP